MWFSSKFLQELQETNEQATIYDCVASNDTFKEYIQDLIDLNVSKENYKVLIELCDFLMIDNVDVFIDKIVIIHDYEYSIIYEFEDFYKYNTKRLIPMDRDILMNAIELYCQDHKKCFHTYGFSSFWNVSNIENMKYMFEKSQFNGDISNWNVSNVKNMFCMFKESQFNQDIYKWNVSNVENMCYMFYNSKFNRDISNWNVSNVESMEYMFYKSQFNQNISNWDVSNVKTMESMFGKSQFNQNISNWVLTSLLHKKEEINFALMFRPCISYNKQ
jgi:surface protein